MTGGESVLTPICVISHRSAHADRFDVPQACVWQILYVLFRDELEVRHHKELEDLCTYVFSRAEPLNTYMYMLL